MCRRVSGKPVSVRSCKGGESSKGKVGSGRNREFDAARSN